MNQVKLNELIKSEVINIPLYVLRMYGEFNLKIDELVLLFFLYDKDKEVFNPKLISEKLNMSLAKVMETVSKLADKDLINVVMTTNEAGLKEEIFDLSPFFNKITFKMMEEFNKEEKSDINIYDILKEEFGRKLTPMECEMVDSWKNSNYPFELIKEAVREATLNGVNSLRYIDKILYEWNKKGYKKKEDIKRIDKTKETKEIYNCDWLDSDEEL